MSHEEIYGDYVAYLAPIMQDLIRRLEDYNKENKAATGFKLYEHLIYRVKAEDSMRDKCRRKGLEQTPQSALKVIRDAIGVRIVTGFVEDIYKLVDRLRQEAGYKVVEEKDYISQVKPNGYRSYHVILEVETDYPDCQGQTPGRYYIEVQLRTIAMDSWASLEHQMKYKHDIANPERISRELKRCADELASCDLTMQTIRHLIQGGEVHADPAS